jgi:hypothetical protein
VLVGDGTPTKRGKGEKGWSVTEHRPKGEKGWSVAEQKELFLEDSFERFFVDEKRIDY